MHTTGIIAVLRLILCNEKMLAWLTAEAKKSETPIDDYAVQIIEFLLCGEAENT